PADAPGAQLDKTVSFVTSSNGSLSPGDTIEIFLVLPDGGPVSASTDSVLVAVGDGGFTSSLWAILTANRDTLRLGMPLAADPNSLIQIRLPGFVNPGSAGSYFFGARTQADRNWVFEQAALGGTVYPIVLLSDTLDWDHNDGNNDVNPGEYIRARLRWKNNGPEPVDWGNYYYTVDLGFDPYVNPPSGRNNHNEWTNTGWVPPGGEFEMYLEFWVSGYAPAGYELRVPVSFYTQGANELVGTDTLRLVVSGYDYFGPWSHMQGPGYVPVGKSAALEVHLFDGSPIASAVMRVRNEENGSLAATLTLNDEGADGDKLSGDGIFTAAFTPAEAADYRLELTATDELGNISSWFDRFHFSSKPFQANHSILLVGGRPWNDPWWLPDFQRAREVLDSLGYEYDFWDGYVRGNVNTNSTLPDSSILEQYRDGLLIYVGWPDWYDWRKFGYMQELNISAWIGSENIAEMSQWGSGEFVPILADYLGAAYAQGYVGEDRAHGVSGDPVAEGLDLWLEGNHWDEMDPAGNGVTSLIYGPGTALASAGAGP
ncbi:MAG TPA: choice-of-anchor X domain-containing protein, partial [Candidatus Glassbacteria bacterium]|nr:choice-of-anchor X domain-containing protein [Candidatus Glassbacteria bacterium]